MLTKKQNELLIYINQNLRETGVAPSYEEMKEALDLRSKSGIHRLINALRGKGFYKKTYLTELACNRSHKTSYCLIS